MRCKLNLFYFTENCTCKDFSNEYDHKQFYMARGLTDNGPSPRDGRTLAFHV